MADDAEGETIGKITSTIENSFSKFPLNYSSEEANIPKLRQQYFLSLYSTHSNKPLKKYKIPRDMSQTGFVFPCGVVVHGGQHIVRLKKNKTVIAESPKFNVSWPKIVIDVPSRLETYRSPADVTFRYVF
ncbi:hypothetical protein Avbf_14988 [Armadillidium vulgare]|nr:hypothetical protein Avbf_14988 [Armadillidium vulgare]